ncbi:MAG: hypothetical protein A2248_06780 [Candidatus Raymondbacteria bacterium RIFOXYA2_FULL_49_16]|nr:MAG: hypothetical protein A2248_06780 [Candidatus Raymondbacteria bacterium RIFOXYA2_FULL_49_16]OGP45428.1 MAG: hypothetical protein A2324_22550 [Candidatus Raymondbacteria bacterium RIFOXYB2_FULL_49_35]
MSMVQRGVVSEIHPDHYVITVIRHSACSTCSTKGACAESEQKPLQVHVGRSGSDRYEKGECVDMHMGASKLISATFLAYILPLMLMLLALFLSGIFISGVSDGVRSVWAFLGLAAGFVLLRILHPLMRKRRSFEITLSKAVEQFQSTV